MPNLPQPVEETTHQRIGVTYHAKLKKLAKKNKRTAIQHLHFLIDQDEAKK
jgi:hypothetical protein